MFRVYGYLRASTEEQDATRAKAELEKFTEQLGSALLTGLLKMNPAQNYIGLNFLGYWISPCPVTFY